MKYFVTCFIALSLSLAFNVSAQYYCGTPTTTSNPYDTVAPQAQLIEDGGPYYFRVYVHVIRRSDGTGGLSRNQVEQSLEFLDLDFNPHDIYFVWDKCIDYIDDDNFYPGVGNNHTAIFNVNNHTDGIDIYYFDESSTNGGGKANGVGESSELWVQGTYPGYGPVATSHIISHEMGHVFFLWHTHHGCETGNFEWPIGSNDCHNAGDYICDTPADPNMAFGVDSETCNWDPNEGITFCQPPVSRSSYSPDVNNIMGYTVPSCMEYFSNGQAARMKNKIALLSHLQDAMIEEQYYCTCNEESDIHIYENTTISNDGIVNGNIYVHAGAKLVINSTIQMGWKKSIIVERGAKLVVDNGILTKCDDIPNWDGIIVEGNKDLSQPVYNSMPSSNEAGIVYIKNNSIVEWAKNALYTKSIYGGSEYWGGLIHCENSMFINNRRVAAFMQYDKFTNNSKFINCTFDGSGYDGNTVGVTIWDTDGITFNRCRFYHMQHSGIHPVDAATIIKDGNDFENNVRGIAARSTYPFSGYLEIGESGADPNYFSDNEIHIEANATNKLAGVQIVNNEFFGGGHGVVLVGPSKFNINENSFNSMNRGVLPLSTGAVKSSQHNYITNNGFSAIDGSGILAVANNKNMQFLCNQYQTTNRDFLLHSIYNGQGAIRRYQGSNSSPAGNCFTFPSIVGDINTYGGTEHFYYFYENSPQCKIPSTQGNYTAIQSSFEGDCSINIIDDPVDFNDLAYVKSQINNVNEDTSYNYLSLIETKENILLELVKNELNNGNVSAALNVLAYDSTTFSKLAQYGIMLDNEMFSQAQSLLNALPSSINEMSDFKQIQAINIDRLQTEGSFELTESEENYLKDISQSDKGVRAYARSILSLLKGIEYIDTFSINSQYGNRIGFKNEKEDIFNLIKVMPNPFRNKITITVKKALPGKKLKIKFYDIHGNLVAIQRKNENQNALRIDNINWRQGVYFVKIVDDFDQRIYQTKIVKY